jgi:plastocyanin domain-containing protein
MSAGVMVVVLGLGLAGGARAGEVRGPVAEDLPGTRVEIEVTARGFVPAVVEVAAGEAVELVFMRTTGSGCAAEVHIPGLGVAKTALPQGKPVRIVVDATEP